MSGEVADGFLIGVAVLTLVGELARERPVLIVADDAQWLDEPSARCLAFVARRLRSGPVVMLHARRWVELVVIHHRGAPRCGDAPPTR